MCLILALVLLKGVASMKNTMQSIQPFLTLEGTSNGKMSFANSKDIDIHHRDMKK